MDDLDPLKTTQCGTLFIMAKHTQRLPGIKFIGWLNADKLQRNVDLYKITGQMIGIFTDIHPVEFSDEPEASCKTEPMNGAYFETATLKFLSPSLLPLIPGRNYGFIVTDVSDNSFLIGSLEPSHATMTIEMRHGFPDGDGAGFYYEIKHVHYRSMVPCVVSTNER